MASSFKSLNLFGSGPHRFARRRQGITTLAYLALDDFQSGSFPLPGLIELDVVVTGRLVAASESALWTIRDAIAAQLLDPPAAGTLIDHAGRSYTGMSFITYTEADRTDRGRVFSIAYTAVFRKFKVAP